MPPLNPFTRSLLAAAVTQTIVLSGAHAATITVDNEGDVSADDTECTLREAVVSLNQASDLADGCDVVGAFGTNDTILFSPTLGPTITLTQALDLSVSNPGVNLTINGPGQGALEINANNNARIMRISDATVSIDGLTMANGYASGVTGGGIYVYESSLTLTNTTISSSSSTSNGGGLFAYNSNVNITGSSLTGNSSGNNGGGTTADSSTVTITNSTVSQNSTGINGAGIHLDGTAVVTIDESVISDNVVDSGNGGGIAAFDTSSLSLRNSSVLNNRIEDSGNGGGIAVFSSSSVTVDNSNIANNYSARNGGGLAIFGNEGGGVDITASTIYNNSVRDYGGGIASFVDKNVSLVNVTIANNRADSVDNSDDRSGGGIHLSNDRGFSLINSTVSNNFASNIGGGIYASDGMEGVFTMINTIVSGNSATNSGAEIYQHNVLLADAINSSFNLLGDDRYSESHAFYNFTPDTTDIDATITGSAVPLANIVNPIADNGCIQEAGTPATASCTLTNSLPTGSPALGAANVPDCPDFDQRGKPRDSGFFVIIPTANSSGAAVDLGDDCDIGAVERAAGD